MYSLRPGYVSTWYLTVADLHQFHRLEHVMVHAPMLQSEQSYNQNHVDILCVYSRQLSLTVYTVE